MIESGKKIYRKVTGSPLAKSWKHFWDVTNLGKLSDAEENEYYNCVISLVKTILTQNAELSYSDLETVRQLFSEFNSQEQVNYLIHKLRSAESITPDAAAKILLKPELDLEPLISALIRLDFEVRNGANTDQFIKELAQKVGMPDAQWEELHSEIANRIRQRQKILGSGAGILVALAIIAVFILTATVLQPVIFGLILAFIVLPLEQFIEKKLYQRKGFFFWMSSMITLLGWPLRKLSNFVVKRRGKNDFTKNYSDERDKGRITSRSVMLSCLTLLVIVTLILYLTTLISSHYLDNVKDTIHNWRETGKSAAGDTAPPPTDTPTAPGEVAVGASEEFFMQINDYLESHRENVENNPVIRFAVTHISTILNDPAARREFIELVMQKTGGFFSFASNLLGFAVSLGANLLLTVFFFLYFLSKLAKFCADNKNADRESAYIVSTVFGGAWMPRASRGALDEAQRILTEILHKLKVWMRGYATLICIDIVVYTTAYYLLGVPYYFVLGPITAVCIILPIIGPLSATVLAMLVTLAVNGNSATMFQLAGILVIYLLQNTIIEQFILYPLIFGSALGLSLLETIIVVLLGGIFAGIPGMIFALPTAAIIKFLVPQIYRSLESKYENFKT